MRAEEFGGWKAKNVGKGGRRPSYDQFNKASKGHERNPAAREFASQGMDEYHHYSEFVDTRDKEKDDKKKNNESSNSSQSSKTNSASKAANQTSGLVRNVVSRVAVAAIGTVVVVNEYQTIQEHEELKNPPIAKATWNYTVTPTAVFKLFKDDTLLDTLPAVIYSSEEEATCEENGKITYIASIEYNGVTYTDTYIESIKAIGHEYELNPETGKLECVHCHHEMTKSDIEVKEE